MVMYYGGDLVDLVLFVLLWSAWYSSTPRRRGGRDASLRLRESTGRLPRAAGAARAASAARAAPEVPS
jgi:hypothetical protein